MCCGKTTEMLRRYNRLLSINQHGLIVKHAIDVRYCEHKIVTHDMCCQDALSVARLSDCFSSSKYKNCEYIFIDEGQFFVDIIPSISRMLNDGKHVTVCALSGDHKMHPFPNIAELLSISDSILHLRALCWCGKAAPFTRKVGGNANLLVEVGGTDMYKPVCREHFC